MSVLLPWTTGLSQLGILGVNEPPLRTLRQVCKLRELPIFTFVNKMDRSSLSPFELVDQIEREFGMKVAPVLWPIGDGERFKVRSCPACS